MTESLTNLLLSFGKAAAVVGILAFSSVESKAQTTKPPPVIEERKTPRADQRGDKDRPTGDNPAAVEEDMRVRRELRLAEKEYQQNVGRARDLSVIVEAMNESYKQKSHLAPEDFKKLEKAEKLAKAIRSAAGGSEDDDEIEQPPKDLSGALIMFVEVATSLKCNVEKTPKHVISTTVIDEANVILELTRIVRALSFPAQTRTP